MASIPDLSDTTVWPDADLDALRAALHAELNRRYVLAVAPVEADNLAARYQDAIGRKDGDPWVQPRGAHDAYRKDAVTAHAGKVWESLIPANVWEPGVTGWREKVPAGSGPAPFRQPLGAHDAYQTGDMVTFEGAAYRSKINNNTWSPTAYPGGWELVNTNTTTGRKS